MARYGQTYLPCVVLLGTRDKDSLPSELSQHPRFLRIRTLHVSMSCPSRQRHSTLTFGLSPFLRCWPGQMAYQVKPSYTAGVWLVDFAATDLQGNGGQGSSSAVVSTARPFFV